MNQKPSIFPLFLAIAILALMAMGWAERNGQLPTLLAAQEAEFFLLPTAGHSAFEDSIRTELLNATDKFAKLT